MLACFLSCPLPRMSFCLHLHTGFAQTSRATCTYVEWQYKLGFDGFCQCHPIQIPSCHAVPVTCTQCLPCNCNCSVVFSNERHLNSGLRQATPSFSAFAIGGGLERMQILQHRFGHWMWQQIGDAPDRSFDHGCCRMRRSVQQPSPANPCLCPATSTWPTWWSRSASSGKLRLPMQPWRAWQMQAQQKMCMLMRMMNE